MPKSTNTLGQLETTLEKYFVDKAPFHLPEDAKEAIVKYGPWVLVLLLALSARGILLGFGYIATFPNILFLIAFILNLVALPGLFKRSKQGWNLLFYSLLVSLLGQILILFILQAVVSALIGFYLLFQIKDTYR